MTEREKVKVKITNDKGIVIQEIEIVLPEGVQIVSRCRECQAKGNLCAVQNSSEVCLTPVLDENQELIGFSVVPCKFNKTKRIEVET